MFKKNIPVIWKMNEEKINILSLLHNFFSKSPFILLDQYNVV